MPAALAVAAAEPDEGGLIPRKYEAQLTGGELFAAWPEYDLPGNYWQYVNAVIGTEVWGGIFTNRRYFAETITEGGSDWQLDISEYYRRGEIVSLTLATSSYYAGAAHPNHVVTTVNIFGDQAGIMGLHDLFEYSAERNPFAFIREYVELDLKRQFGPDEPMIDFDELTEISGSGVFEQFNVNNAGIRLNFSAASGFPHVMGLPEVYIPWQSVGDFLKPAVRRLLLEP